MSLRVSVYSIAAAGFTAMALVAAIVVSAEYVWAADATQPSGLCAKSPLAATPTLTALPPPLNQDDEDAALESVQFALTEVADGSTYVWHRSHGRLSGIVQPVSSFKDTKGAVCRHAIVVLSGVDTTKKTEIVACRLPTGVWQLES